MNECGNVILREFGRERASGTRVNARHAKDALRVIELLPIQIQYWNLHRTCRLAFLTVRAFDRVAMDSEQAVLLEDCHNASDGADVSAPESGDSPCCIDESYQDQNIDPSECRYAS